MIKKYLGSFIVFHHKYSSRELRKIIQIELEKDKFLFFTQWLSQIIAILFMIGSFCFILASAFLLFVSSKAVVDSAPLIYFIGSIFFTSAAYLQYLQTINADITNEEHLHQKNREWKWFAYRKHNLGFWSSFVQFIGTLLFNVNTYGGMITNINESAQNILISIPNMLGSICFLLASFFAWLEVYHDKDMKTLSSLLWWIIWLNIIGSIFFQISALYALDLEDMKAQTLAIYYTMFGGVAFFIASYLLIPESKLLTGNKQ